MCSPSQGWPFHRDPVKWRRHLRRTPGADYCQLPADFVLFVGSDRITLHTDNFTTVETFTICSRSNLARNIDEKSSSKHCHGINHRTIPLSTGYLKWKPILSTLTGLSKGIEIPCIRPIYKYLTLKMQGLVHIWISISQ